MNYLVEGLRKREVMRTINVFKDRKIKFEERKKKITCYLTKEQGVEIYVNLVQKANFKSGLMNIILLDENELKYVYSKYEKANEYLERLKNGGSVTRGFEIILTTDYDLVIQHELQHVFDNLIEFKTSDWEHEYRAYLGGLHFSKEPVQNNLNEIYLYNMNLKRSGCDENEPHYVASEKLIKELEFSDRLKDSDLRMISKILLDANYKEHMGKTYNEILEELIEETKGY